MSDNHELDTVQAGPLADPGLPPHQPRPTDVDPAAEKRAERQVATLFGLSSVFAVLFCVAYFALKVGHSPTVFLGLGASNVALGVCLGLSLLCIGFGAIQWARKLMTDEEIIEMRHPAASSEEDREESITAFRTGVEESGIGRRPLVRNSLIGAMAMLGLPAIVALRDLGPLPGDKLFHTVWKKGMRVVQDVDGSPIRPSDMVVVVQDVDGSPIRPSDMVVGQLVNGQPEVFFRDAVGETQPEGTQLQIDKAKAAVIIVRMLPDDITPSPGREKWGVDGILCYSKICTHVGCPISLWEQQTHHLLCPCHQSTFDLADNGRVVFGPAARPLPQLPIKVDAQGYLVAQSDFTEPVGPSFWERG